jgi:hypothetical protein
MQSEAQQSRTDLIYRNKHDGETVLIVAGGPSVNDFNVNDIQRFTSIGINQISRRFDPTYVTLFDSPTRFGEGMAPALRSLLKSIVVCTARHSTEWTILHDKSVRDQQRVHTLQPWGLGKDYIRFDRGEYQTVFNTWDWEEDWTIPFGPTSTGVACWLAAFMGAKRIGIIGLDLGGDYFFKSDKPHATDPEAMKMAITLWGQLAFHMKEWLGVEIFNLSNQSLVDTVPHAEFGHWLMENGS